MTLHGGHAPPARRRALLLPGVLLLAGGTAFGGLAVLPAAAADTPPAATGTGEQTATVERVEARRTAAVRASRERRPVAAPPTPAAPEFARPGTGRLTSSYGPRWGRLHGGIDLAAGTGAPISAVTHGTVTSAGTEGGYGHVVRVDHGDGTVTVYAHLSEIRVALGQAVTAGQLLGLEGSSGHSTGPHLHFEVRVADVPVGPAAWLQARGVIL